MKQSTYTLKSCEELIDRCVNQYKGELTILDEGVLGLGLILLHSAQGKKTIVIKEVYVSAWSSTHTIRMYNKIPKKYNQLLN
jgi:hypothetical protein